MPIIWGEFFTVVHTNATLFSNSIHDPMSSRNSLRRAAAEWAQDFHCPPQNLECALPWVAQRRSLVLRRRGRPLGPALPGPVPGDWRPVWVGRSPAGGARGRADTSLGPVSGVRRRPHTPLRRARRRDSDLTLSMGLSCLTP